MARPPAGQRALARPGAAPPDTRRDRPGGGAGGPPGRRRDAAERVRTQWLDHLLGSVRSLDREPRPWTQDAIDRVADRASPRPGAPRRAASADGPATRP